MAMDKSCPPSLDNVWGPSINPRRRAFDFTLLFEQSILSIVPSGLCLLATIPRVWILRNRSIRVGGQALSVFKLLLVAATIALQLSLVALWSQNVSYRTAASVPAAVISLLAAVALFPLIWLEHHRCIRPSAIISGYFFLTSILDLAQMRTLWLIGSGSSIPSVFSALFATRIVCLITESLNKSRYFILGNDKNRSPEETCGILSRSFFLWLNQMILLGYRRPITEKDLYPLPATLSPQTLEAKLLESWMKESSQGKYGLLKATAAALKVHLLSPVVPRICMVGFTICQPILLQRLISYLNASSSSNDGYGLLGSYALVYLGLAVSQAWFYHQTFKFIAAVRAGLAALIYDKTTRLSISADERSSATTIMSADVERIVVGLRSIHDIWANVIQVSLAAWLLEREVEIAIVGPLVLAAVCGWGALRVGQASVGQQKSWLEKIEKRITVTTETISSIQSLKLLGLTTVLTNMIQRLRVLELGSAGIYRRWEVGALVTGFFPILISPVLTFAIFIAVSDPDEKSLDASRMFVSLSYLALMSQPLSMLFQCGPQLMSMIGCFDRVEKFLRKPQSAQASGESTSCSSSAAPGVKAENNADGASTVQEPKHRRLISVRNGHFGWDAEKPVLHDINLSIDAEQLVMVVGPVGCGKSTLLKALLRETSWSKGSVDMPQSGVAFCDQTPWIINGTFRENVVMFADEHDGTYKAVLEACALQPDLAQSANGDATNLGSRGRTLSGGQKQRISIARACFARRPLNVFDDVLSGLDAHTEMHVFASVFGPAGLLRKPGTTTVLATNSVHFLPCADHIICIGADGRTANQGSFTELSQRNSYVQKLQIRPEVDFTTSKHPSEPTIYDERPLKREKVDQASEEADSPTTNGVYRYYIKATGPLTWLLFATVGVGFAFLYTFPYVWAKWWSDANETHPGERQAYYMGIFALLQALSLIALIAFAWNAVITIITAAGTSLHWTLIKTTLSAPSSFFDRTDTGKTLNRFSQDMQLIDRELPSAQLKIAYNGLIVLGQLLLIMNTSYWLALSYPAIFAVLWGIQKIYLKTSRRLRHLELASQSPLYSQFVETLDGLATIRAFNWRQNFKALIYQRLDQSQRPFYLLLCVQRWLALVLDCLSAGFVLLLVGLIVALHDRISIGFVGVALTNMINLSSLMTNLVDVWTEMETSITSIQRIRDFEAETPSEFHSEAIDPPPDWPSQGAIEIRSLSAAYREDASTVLRNVNMSIRSGEKIAICGRSGSGKTSLMLALFRMIETRSGTVEIDGVDITSVPLDRLRSELNAIPQDSCFIEGSFRFNADPFGIRTDEEIWQALTSVRLDAVVQRLGGLDADLSRDSLSHGERQLFSLARALLKRNRVVIMDEATSNIDIETEKTISNVIATHFQSCTVISIAHRLNTILHCDRIALLDAGELVEFDDPKTLLAQESQFKALYDALSSNSGLEAHESEKASKM